MKESTNKTAGRTQTGQNKSATKSSRTTTSHASSTSRGTAKSQSSATAAYRAATIPKDTTSTPKNRRATANDAVRLSIECRKDCLTGFRQSRLLSADRPADLQGIHAAGSSGNRAGTDFAHTIRNG